MKTQCFIRPKLISALFNVALLLSIWLPCRAQWTVIEHDLPIGVAESDPGVLNGKVYLFGGNITNDTVWVFDPASGWSFGGIMPDSMEAVVVEEFNGKFYLFGGHSHPDFVYRTEVMTYDLATQVFDTVGQMPTAKAWFTSAVLGDKIYLIGGDNYVSGASNTVDIFDPATGNWSVGPPTASKRVAASADTLGGKIYVTGGSDYSVVFNSIEIFDPVTGWQTSPTLMNHGRGFHACKTFDEKLFAMGGMLSFTQSVSNTVEYFDPQLGEWIEFDTLNFARGKLGAAALGGNALYAMGGLGTAGFIMEVEKYELEVASRELKMPSSFIIYPNPAANYFTLHMEGWVGNSITVDLFSITDQKLLTETLSFQLGKIDKTFSCKDFPKGVYFIRVTGIHGMGVQKIVIQ
jgi:Secretion system C-terminal sorting domain/Kelch motif